MNKENIIKDSIKILFENIDKKIKILLHDTILINAVEAGESSTGNYMSVYNGTPYTSVNSLFGANKTIQLSNKYKDKMELIDSLFIQNRYNKNKCERYLITILNHCQSNTDANYLLPSELENKLRIPVISSIPTSLVAIQFVNNGKFDLLIKKIQLDELLIKNISV